MIGSNMIKGVWCCLIFSIWFNTSIHPYHQNCWEYICFTASPTNLPSQSLLPNPFRLFWSGLMRHISQWLTSFRKNKIKTKEFALCLLVFLSTSLLFSFAIFFTPEIHTCGKHDVSEILGLQRAGCNHRSDACCGTSCAQTGISSAPKLLWFHISKDFSSTFAEKNVSQSFEWRWPLFLLTIEVFLLSLVQRVYHEFIRVSFVWSRVWLATRLLVFIASAPDRGKQLRPTRTENHPNLDPKRTVVAPVSGSVAILCSPHLNQSWNSRST